MFSHRSMFYCLILTNFLLTMLWCTGVISHQKPLPLVRLVQVSGNHFFSERQILEILPLKPAISFSLPLVHQWVKELYDHYHQNGFYFARIDVSHHFNTDSTFVDITLSIEEGERVEIGKIEIYGNSAITTDEIFTRFDTHVGTFLQNTRLERDINNLLSLYEQIGYPFASVQVQEIVPYRDEESTKLSIVLSIVEGDKVLINEVQVKGNKETKESVIVRESRIRLGEPYNHERVLRVPRLLRRLNIFSNVAEPELYVGSNGGGLVLEVEEGNSNLFDGVVGYMPRTSEQETGFFTGVVNVSMRNLFGTTRKLFVRWQKDERQSQEIALKYVEPWLFNVPVDITGEFQQRKQDTIYVRRLVGGNVDLRLTEYFSVGGIVALESVIPSGTSTLFNSQTITSGVILQYDSRNDIISPTAGVLYRSDYQIGTKTLSSTEGGMKKDGKSVVQKVHLDTEWYVQPFARQVAAVGLHGRQLTNKHIQVSDYYRFGGARTLRGYRENQFMGTRAAWTNAEYRFLLARRSFVYCFFDTGYFFLPNDDVREVPSMQKLMYGYGVGIRLETRLGSVGVSFALGEGDTFQQTKIHVELLNEF